jgi:6-hydroxynicotinate reductase
MLLASVIYTTSLHSVKLKMNYHNKTDGIGQFTTVDSPREQNEADSKADFLVRAKPRNERMASDKIECNACPVLCQILN